MSRLLFAALGSGSGKTTVTCAFLRAAQRRKIACAAFKCGPDYIDPMFHRAALGLPSRNLDLFLCSPQTVRQTLTEHAAQLNVLEGVMGFYDGVGGSTFQASAWQLARVTQTPVVLVVRPSGVGACTLAAQICGLRDYQPPSGLAAILLNDCSSMLARSMAPVLERETGLPVLGALPCVENARFESRHLGLVTAGELPELSGKLDALAAALEEHCDLPRLLALAASAPALPAAAPTLPKRGESGGPVIAVARDAAFCFCYPDNPERLEQAGARLTYFSPLTDSALPPCQGLYLPGGYPELYARRLSENLSMRQSIAAAVRAGMPAVAECGGFLYLQQSLEDEQGTPWPMCGALPGRGFGTGRLQRFGYAVLTAHADNLLLHAGEQLPVHSFHYWDSTQNGTDLTAEKPVSGRRWECGVCTPSLFASFAHLHFGARDALAQRFVGAAARFAGGSQNGPKT